MCIVTSKGQIYHNRPLRPAGYQVGDEYLFDESVVWDLPVGYTARRHPSNNPSESRTGYRYDPTLHADAYVPVPAINQDNGYGNGGFGDTIGTGDMIRPRFYQFQEPNRINGDNNKNESVDLILRILGYITKTRKGCFAGTYQINRSRIPLVSTPDGGRN